MCVMSAKDGTGSPVLAAFDPIFGTPIEVKIENHDRSFGPCSVGPCMKNSHLLFSIRNCYMKYVALYRPILQFDKTPPAQGRFPSYKVLESTSLVEIVEGGYDSYKMKIDKDDSIATHSNKWKSDLEEEYRINKTLRISRVTFVKVFQGACNDYADGDATELVMYITGPETDQFYITRLYVSELAKETYREPNDAIRYTRTLSKSVGEKLTLSYILVKCPFNTEILDQAAVNTNGVKFETFRNGADEFLCSFWLNGKKHCSVFNTVTMTKVMSCQINVLLPSITNTCPMEEKFLFNDRLIVYQFSENGYQRFADIYILRRDNKSLLQKYTCSTPVIHALPLNYIFIHCTGPKIMQRHEVYMINGRGKIIKDFNKMYSVLCVAGEPLVICTPTRAVFIDDDMSEVLTSIESTMFNDSCTQYSFNLDGKRVMNVTPHIVNVAGAYIFKRLV